MFFFCPSLFQQLSYKSLRGKKKKKKKEKGLAHGNQHIRDDNVIGVINPLHSAMTHAYATVICLRTDLWPPPSNVCGNVVPGVWPAGVIPVLMAEYLVCIESRSCPLGKEGPYFVWM